MPTSIVLCRPCVASPGVHLLQEPPLEVGALGALEMGEAQRKEMKLQTNKPDFLCFSFASLLGCMIILM